MNTLNEQVLEEYNRLSIKKIKLVEETKVRLIEELNKSHQIYDKYLKKIKLEENNIVKKVEFQNFLLPTSGNKDKLYLAEELMKSKDKYIKEKFHSNETNHYFINIDSDIKKQLTERSTNYICSISELHEILILIYERDIIKYQNEFRNKNKQYLELEKAFLEILQQNKINQEEIGELKGLLNEENNKYISLVNELNETFRVGKKEDFDKLLQYLTNNVKEFDIRINRHNSCKKVDSKTNYFDSFSNRENIMKQVDSLEEFNSNMKNRNKTEQDSVIYYLMKAGLSNNMYDEFENVIGEEFKRIEGYYLKDKRIKKQQIPKERVKKRTEVEKNYAEWKPRSSWITTLRTDSNTIKENSTINTEGSRDRIRNSIRNILSLKDKIEKNSRTISEEHNSIRSNEVMYSENNYRLINQSVSPVTTNNINDQVQKNINIQNKINETVDKKLRKMVFNYRKKDKFYGK